MEHARKMVLVPEENLSLLSTQSRQQSTFNIDTSGVRPSHSNDATLNRLDAEMNEILNSNTYKDEREKWTAYLTVLQRYLHFVDDERAQQHHTLMKKISIEPIKREEEQGKEDQIPDNMNDSIIIESVPAKYRHKAKLLLRRLHTAPTAHFTWDSDGLVSISGKPIKDSNIVDLVNDAMRARKVAPPAGRRTFAKFLKATQTPREFIGNDELWQETRANSTLQNSTLELSSDEDDDDDLSQSSTYSDTRSQLGNGYCNNKKRRVTWLNLKL